MKGLLRKCIVVMLMLAMLIQMAGLASAGIYEWISGGPHIANATGVNDKDEIRALTGNEVEHTYGKNEYIQIPSGTYIRCNANTSFPPIYETQLNNALENEGLFEYVVYDRIVGDRVTISYVCETGTYIARIVFKGKDGTWWVKGTDTSEGTPMTITSGTFQYAPSHYEVGVYKID